MRSDRRFLSLQRRCCSARAPLLQVPAKRNPSVKAGTHPAKLFATTAPAEETSTRTAGKIIRASDVVADKLQLFYRLGAVCRRLHIEFF